MENVRFKLKKNQKGISPSNQKETLISLVFSYGYSEISNNGKKTYIPFVYSTGLRIKPNQWCNKRYRAKQTKTFDYQSFNAVLDDIEGSIKQIYRKNNNISPYEMRTELDIKLGKKQKVEIIFFIDFVEKFISEIKDGTRKTPKGTNYKVSTIKAFVNFKNIFIEYERRVNKKIKFSDINMSFYKKYEKYLNSLNFSPNTIGKHFKNVKAIMRESLELKLHNNSEVEKKGFKVIKKDVSNIYLSEKEISSILNLDLSHDASMEKYRDVFIVGCFTAQRFSDYSRIKKINIRKIDNTTVIELDQQKTGEKVIIPIRSELDVILKKYDYKIPKVYDQKLNKYIKEIGRLAGINELIENKKVRGGKTIVEVVPKYKLITTHTARRSGATNMYLAGIPSIDIMKLTGHTTEVSFLKYIKVTKQETAVSLSSHPYFK